MKRIVSILIAVVMLTACVVSVATNAFAEQAAEATYVKAATLENGDKVIVYNPAHGMAMSKEDKSADYPEYRMGVEVTVTDNKITNPDAAIVWTVNATDAGVEFVSADGEKLSCTGRKLLLGETDTVWTVSNATTEGCVYIASTSVKGNEGDPVSIEWFERYSEFSTFYYKESDEALFALQLFVLEAPTAETSSEATSDASAEAPTETSNEATSDASTEASSDASAEASADASADTSSTTEPAGPDLGAVNADAVFGTTLTATVEGNTVTVKIGVKDVTANDISIFGVDLYYDATKVEPVVKNDGLNKHMLAFLTKKPGEDWDDCLCKLNEEKGCYELSFMATDPKVGLADGNAEITVTFTVKEGAEGDLTFYMPHASVDGGRGKMATKCRGNGAVASVAVPTEDESSADTSSVAAPEASSAASSDATSQGDTPVTGDAGVVVVVILAVVAAFGSAVVVKARR